MEDVTINIRELFYKTDHLEDLVKLVDWNGDGKLFLDMPGNQHYRLLAHLSSKLKPGSKILEIGTRWGVGSAALASNKDVHVITCDIDECDPRVPKMDNIEYVKEDGYVMLDNCHEYAMIFIDVDPHDGIQEKKMILKLLDKRYKGVVILDDIRLNPEMFTFWTRIPLEDHQKVDLTTIGHYSGTGMLLFD
jgi:predicted O-methyltransferase YrrM